MISKDNQRNEKKLTKASFPLVLMLIFWESSSVPTMKELKIPAKFVKNDENALDRTV